MFPALPFQARWTAALIALVSAGSVVALFVYNLETDRYGTKVETAWAMARFFTILTHVGVVLTFTAAALRRSGIGAPWIAALTLSVVLVGVVFHALLSDITAFEGLGQWANQGLHTVVPAACLVWWVAFAPKRMLDYGNLPMFVVWPCVYVAYALARGAQDGVYPYPFMDLATRSSAEVVLNLAGLLIVLLIGGVVFVMIGKFTDR